MKKIAVFLLMVLFLTAGAVMAQETTQEPTPDTGRELALADGKKPGKSIFLEITIKSVVKGKKVHMEPKIRTADGKDCSVFIGDKRTTLNDKEVESSPEAKKELPFIAKLTMKPQIQEGTNPRLIQMNVEFSVENNGVIIKRNLTAVIADQKTWEMEDEDVTNKEYTRLAIKATIVNPDQDIVKDEKTGKYVLKSKGDK